MAIVKAPADRGVEGATGATGGRGKKRKEGGLSDGDSSCNHACLDC